MRDVCGVLPETGGDTMTIFVLAAVIVAAGLGACWLGRRRCAPVIVAAVVAATAFAAVRPVSASSGCPPSSAPTTPAAPATPPVTAPAPTTVAGATTSTTEQPSSSTTSTTSSSTTTTTTSTSTTTTLPRPVPLARDDIGVASGLGDYGAGVALLDNDDLGDPPARLQSFNGMSIFPVVFEFHSGTVTIHADGTGYIVTFVGGSPESWSYTIANDLGETSTATLTLAFG